MRELQDDEINQTSGGAIPVDWAAGTTLGLMALAPASIAVMTTGMVALAFYGAAKYYGTIPVELK
ncbi:MAG: hypothetical protein L6Q75_17915 [Burkholderiaceae bacterium]|nr:hypothetical protein [Burkholderiaceae bacterium]